MNGSGAEFVSAKESFYQNEVEQSIVVALAWIMDTPEFRNQAGEIEVPDDESRADQIGEVYSYALSEGVDYDRMDELHAKALE